MEMARIKVIFLEKSFKDVDMTVVPRTATHYNGSNIYSGPSILGWLLLLCCAVAAAASA